MRDIKNHKRTLIDLLQDEHFLKGMFRGMVAGFIVGGLMFILLIIFNKLTCN